MCSFIILKKSDKANQRQARNCVGSWPSWDSRGTHSQDRKADHTDNAGNAVLGAWFN